VKREALLDRVGTERVKETNAFVRWMFQKPHPEEYYDAIVQQALKTPTDAALALLRDLYAVRGWKVDYAKIQIPVLCFASESYYPQGLWLQKRIPGLRLQEMKGDGHALFADDPKGFNPRLQDFLSQIQSK